jgi:tetratricopeptide (TPR) repeat protein
MLLAENGLPNSAAYLKRIQDFMGTASVQYVTAKSWIDMSEGRFASAAAVVDTMVTFDDLFPLAYTQGVAYLRAERWPEAVEKLELSRDMLDAFSLDWPHFNVRTRFYLAQAYAGVGQNAKAIQEYEAFIETWKDADSLFSGEVADARARLEKLRSTPRKS